MMFTAIYYGVLDAVRHDVKRTQLFNYAHTHTKQAKRYARIQKAAKILEKNVCSSFRKKQKLVRC